VAHGGAAAWEAYGVDQGQSQGHLDWQLQQQYQPHHSASQPSHQYQHSQYSPHQVLGASQGQGYPQHLHGGHYQPQQVHRTSGTAHDAANHAPQHLGHPGPSQAPLHHGIYGSLPLPADKLHGGPMLGASPHALSHGSHLLAHAASGQPEPYMNGSANGHGGLQQHGLLPAYNGHGVSSPTDPNHAAHLPGHHGLMLAQPMHMPHHDTQHLGAAQHLVGAPQHAQHGQHGNGAQEAASAAAAAAAALHAQMHAVVEAQAAPAVPLELSRQDPPPPRQPAESRGATARQSRAAGQNGSGAAGGGGAAAAAAAAALAAAAATGAGVDADSAWADSLFGSGPDTQVRCSERMGLPVPAYVPIRQQQRSRVSLAMPCTVLRHLHATRDVAAAHRPQP
jgi:hypothetical protein